MEQHKKKNIKESTKEILKSRKKESKNKLKQKRARVVIRNLPFKATEENLREHFERFGEIDDVQVLKKEDGKLVGCGFVQFKHVQKAAKAKHYTDNQPFLGRNISVDFASAKNKYESKMKSEIKQENIEEDVKLELIEIEIKEEEELSNKLLNKETKLQETSSNDHQSSSEEGSEDEIEDTDEQYNQEKEEPHLKMISNDVSEGKTVFVKNIPFSATNDDLKFCMSQFGRIYYALICVDKFTEHSKGTGFVKFCLQDDAEKALQAGTELTLLGNILDCHKALGRNEIHQKANDKKDKNDQKDSRNLYLVKEGIILAGTKSAEGVSVTDMAKRLQLEQYKTQMLRNLNMFVSRDRVVVHNLPSTWDDQKLRSLVTKFGGKGAVIKEARVMRDLRNLNAEGIGKSKEFGFVTFTTHDHALNALRTLNNNPNVFSESRRPIVTFSIEKKSAVNAKLKRMEKSRLKNPKSKVFDSKLVKKDALKKDNRFNKNENRFNKNESRFNKNENRLNNNENQNQELNDFAGVAAKPGVQKMRNRFKLDVQAKTHYQNIKKEKVKKKLQKKSFNEKRKEFTKQDRQKINKNKERESDNFSKLVNQYKSKLAKFDVTSGESSKTKWYNA